MAKKGSRSRVRVFLAEFEGDDETIQEGLQAISVAAGKMFESKPSVVKVIAGSSESTQISLPELENDSNILDDSEESVIDIPSTSSSKRSKKPSSKLQKLSIAKDLTLRPAGKVAFKDFFKEKSPTTHEQAVTVAIYWLQRILELKEDLKPNHVFTCLKDVEYRQPKNLAQTIRDTAKRQGWVDTSQRGNAQITNLGEEFVEHDLPLAKN